MAPIHRIHPLHRVKVRRRLAEADPAPGEVEGDRELAEEDAAEDPGRFAGRNQERAEPTNPIAAMLSVTTSNVSTSSNVS